MLAPARSLFAKALRLPSDAAFAFAVSFLWLAFYNFSFWQRTIVAMWAPSLSAAAFIASLFVLVLTLQALLLILMPTRWLMRVAASALFVVAAVTSWFTQTYGAVMNKEMLRNAFETDAAEVSGLLNADLLFHVAIFGFIPALLVWKIRLPDRGWGTQVRQRLIISLGALALSTAGLFACSVNYAVYFREYKPIRFTLTPAAPVTSAMALIAHTHARQARSIVQNPAGASRRTAPPGRKPLVLFIVVGETARAANFQLTGYDRQTNPGLSAIKDLVYFRQASSCGTSTAVSVPCMFSQLSHEAFDVDDADAYANLLDALADAGFDVEWRDNNAGCKGVCKRTQTISYSGNADSALCHNGYCYDEILMKGLEERLRHITRDTVIVFHQIGSHGPAYFERYPPEFNRFQPECRNRELQHCSVQEVINAYDNTILYTDHVLSKQIALLEEFSDRLDGALLYASDHGESLGEQGLYLHGMPYAFAPSVQKEVPMLLWASHSYARRMELDLACLHKRGSSPVSHDHIYHTVLGAAETRNDAYRMDLDLLAGCRSSELPLDHE